MPRALILLGSGLLLTPVAGFFGSIMVFGFLEWLLPTNSFINQVFLIGVVVGGIFGSMLAAPVTLAALPLAGWLAPNRNWKSLLILLAAGTAGGFASPAILYPKSSDGTWHVGLWLLGALSGLVVAVPFYFMTTRRVISRPAG
jgi:hypothetical protein